MTWRAKFQLNKPKHGPLKETTECAYHEVFLDVVDFAEASAAAMQYESVYLKTWDAELIELAKTYILAQD